MVDHVATYYNFHCVSKNIPDFLDCNLKTSYQVVSGIFVPKIIKIC